MTEKEMQLIIGRKIGIKNICIPNVLLVGEYKKEDLPEIEKMEPLTRPCKMYEADLIYITGAGYLTEVEIKVNINDFRNDFNKKIYHSSPLVNAFYYAVPDELFDKYHDEIYELIKDKAGLITVSRWVARYKIRAPKRATAKRLNSELITEFLRIGCLKWFKEW